MKKTMEIYQELFIRYPQLVCAREDILTAYEMMKDAVLSGGTLFFCGNGGSHSDSAHIVGELLKSFKKARPLKEEVGENLLSMGEEGAFLAYKLQGAIPAFSLGAQTGFSTAFSNDVAPELAFAQELYGLAKAGDCLCSISTSGNSKNCVLASLTAQAMNVKTVALTGEGGGKLKGVCNACICVPERETYKVQELHLPIYHTLCAMLEEELF